MRILLANLLANMWTCKGCGSGVNNAYPRNIQHHQQNCDRFLELGQKNEKIVVEPTPQSQLNFVSKNELYYPLALV